MITTTLYVADDEARDKKLSRAQLQPQQNDATGPPPEQGGLMSPKMRFAPYFVGLSPAGAIATGAKFALIEVPTQTREIIIYGRPDDHLWTKQGKKCPFPGTRLMIIYGQPSSPSLSLRRSDDSNAGYGRPLSASSVHWRRCDVQLCHPPEGGLSVDELPSPVCRVRIAGHASSSLT
jgi:hypothetical protein